MAEVEVSKDVSAALMADRTRETPGDSLFQKLQDARNTLLQLVTQANQVLEKNPLTPLVAAQLGGEGLHVNKSGSVVVVTSESTSSPAQGKKYNTSLPGLDELRTRAMVAGIDPAPFGRKKHALLAAIQEAENRPLRKVTGQAVPVSLVPPDAS